MNECTLLGKKVFLVISIINVDARISTMDEPFMITSCHSEVFLLATLPKDGSSTLVLSQHIHSLLKHRIH
jgi:hypothetical protein